MVIYVPLLFALIGILMYALAVNPKLVEIGRLLFWTSWLAFLLTSYPTLIHIGTGGRP